MMARCYNPHQVQYHRYGAKGVQVCERWHKIENFIADMPERPKGCSLDRFPDGNGNYEPGNVRWATPTEQSRNRKSNVLTIEAARKIRAIYNNGETRNNIAVRFGVTLTTVHGVLQNRIWRE